MSFPFPVLLFFALVMSIAYNPAARAEPAPSQQQDKQIWASLTYNKTNGRIGPSKQFPILWFYHSKYLPVKILRKSREWSKIEDMDGVVLWMHNSVLNTRRTALVISEQPTHLFGTGRKSNQVIARVEANVIVYIDICEKTRCQVRVSDQTGWINIADLWGATGS